MTTYEVIIIGAGPGTHLKKPSTRRLLGVRLLLLHVVTAFGAEGEIRGHFLLADGTGKSLKNLGWFSRLLQGLELLGHLRAGLAQASHQVPKFLGIFRQLLGSEENEGQNREDDEFLEIDAEHIPPR
jgi:hypothetical protein